MSRATTPKFWNLIHAAMAGALTVACAGGGGGGSGGPQPIPQPQPQQPAPQQPASFNTGLTGTVGAPVRASFGSAPAQTAAPGGPAFDTSGGSNTFPVLVSSLKSAAGNISAVTPNPNATATFGTSGQFTTLRLTVPAANLDQTFDLLTAPLVAGGALLNGANGDWVTTGFSYVLMGEWGQPAAGADGSVTGFVFGYETPAAAMPGVGSATFSGRASGTVFKPTSGTIHATSVWGDTTLSVNFGSGTITGAFINMQQANGTGGTLPWNDVSVTANITGNTNKFSGGTAATSAPSTTMGLAGSATGYIDGAFYGPNAENLGAVWSLSDGAGSALGTVTAGR